MEHFKTYHPTSHFSHMMSTPVSNTQYHSQSKSQQSITTFLRYSLMELLKITLDGAPHFIRCYKPNNEKESNIFEREVVQRQMQNTAILKTVKARKNGYPIRMTFVEFLRRYCFLGFSFDERVVATKENCQVLVLPNQSCLC